MATGTPLDYARCDIWAAGATLYHSMYGASPFQRAMDQPGGSLALAVLNGSIMWPKGRGAGDPSGPGKGVPGGKGQQGNKRGSKVQEPDGGVYPEPLHELAHACMHADPMQRPSAAELAAWARRLLGAVPPVGNVPQ